MLLGFAFSKSLSTVGRTLTWAPLAIVAVVVLGYLALHVRKRRIERAEADAFAERDAPRPGRTGS